MGIEIRLSAADGEAACFDQSPLLDAVLSWHVLADAGHHTLQLQWVRACRRLPTELRTELRRMSWIAGGYVPSIFTWSKPGADFDAQATFVRGLPEDLVVRELGQALRNAPIFGFNRPASEIAYWTNRIETDVRAVLWEFLDVLDIYWKEAFAEEWARIGERMTAFATTLAARVSAGDLWSVLSAYRPEIDTDPARRLISLDRPHDHQLSVTAKQPLTVMISDYAWPHVRILCDMPWAPVLILPTYHLLRRRRAAQAGRELLTPLRALASESRLDILVLLARQPRSTSELGTLLGLSAPAVSRGLHQLEKAGLVRTRREGLYVLYSSSSQALDDLAELLSSFIRGLAHEPRDDLAVRRHYSPDGE